MAESARPQGLSIWLKADFDVLVRRVRSRTNRPLLQTPDLEGALRRLIDDRYPLYALADVTVVSADGPHEMAAAEAMQALMSHLNVHALRRGPSAAVKRSNVVTASCRQEQGASCRSK